jgi:phage-related protein
MKGITFGNYHSFRDFRLILSPNNAIGTPTPKYELIDIPGGDGMLDFTEAFGEVKYGNRPMSFEFSTMVPQTEFLSLFATVQNALHGQKMKIILDDDPGFYYMGRITVSEWKASRLIGKLTIDCDCEPFKYKSQKTVVSATLDGTSNNLYDFNKLNLVSTTIKKRPDGFLEVDADNKSGAWQYITFFHDRYPEGEITPNQSVTIIMETKDFEVSGITDTRLYFTSVNEVQQDYFTPSSFSTHLETHDRKTASLYPAPIKDAATIAAAVYFIRSFIALPNGSKCKGLFRVSILPGDVRPENYQYVSRDGTMKGLRLVNGKKRVVPTITATAPFTLYHEGNTYAITAGTTTMPEIELKEGVNDIAVKGTGTITFTYQEGVL